MYHACRGSVLHAHTVVHVVKTSLNTAKRPNDSK